MDIQQFLLHYFSTFRALLHQSGLYFQFNMQPTTGHDEQCFFFRKRLKANLIMICFQPFLEFFRGGVTNFDITIFHFMFVVSLKFILIESLNHIEIDSHFFDVLIVMQVFRISLILS